MSLKKLLDESPLAGMIAIPPGGLSQFAPPWLISAVLHLLLTIVLALYTLPPLLGDRLVELEVAYGQEETLQDDEPLELPTLEMDTGADLVLEDLPQVLDPLAALPELDTRLLAAAMPSPLVAPTVGVALSGREPGARRSWLAQHGGSGATEEAVQGGLEWLARNQLRDGSWTLEGPYADGSPVDANPTAATAMALLAFQGAGNTHRRGEFQQRVERGWQALLKMQNADGDFYTGVVPNQHLYSHAQATIAVCELYGMTRDAKLREPAERAVAFCLRAQSPEGGWRYYPGRGADTSVTGWYVMALESAKMAGLEVPPENLRRISGFLDDMQREDGSRYVYQPLREVTPTMTAEALLCRQYLGWNQQDPRLISGAEYVLAHPIDSADAPDVYYWYYATQFLHHMQGNYWTRWNDVMREVIPQRQVARGKERGSWDPDKDRWGHLGGRLYTTCLSIYMLEVYYRHLPIYSYRK